MTVAQLLEQATPILLYACGLFALQMWWRQRSNPTVWLLASFLALDSILLLSDLGPEDPPLAVNAITIVLLLAFPYCLARFSDAMVPLRPWVRRTADVVFPVVAVASVGMILAAPEALEAEDGASAGLLVLIIGEWFGLLLLAAWHLFSNRRGRATIVRNRMTMMAGGAFSMGLALLLSAPTQSAADQSSTTQETASDAGDESAPSSDENATQTIVVQGFASLSAILFLIGFAPPAFLRAAWRREDEDELYEAAVQFLSVDDPAEVAEEIMPRIRAVLGAPGVALLEDGEVIATSGEPPLPGGPAVSELPMGHYTLRLTTDPTMPLLNEGDASFVGRLGVLADLAAERARLMQAERAAQVELQEVNAELESFVYTTSHDLKNPIIAMLGYIDLLQAEYAADLPEEAQRFVTRMHANASFMEALIRDLLELSRVGRVDAEPDCVDLESLIDGLRQDLERRHPAVQLTRGELPELWMNPTRCRQLFVNLVENAAKYGGRDAITIDVSATRRDDGGWIIAVADDGVGIPEEYRERVFGVFERLDAKKDGGTGMGLAICRRIVDQAGGHIRVAPSDVGARFEIDMPPSALPSSSTVEGDREEVAS